MEKLPLLTSRMGIYEHPRHMPGYTGHCPQEKHSHGETFGNSTGHWYNSYRQRILSNSNERLGRGGHSIIPFPAYYQNEPSLVVGSTQRSHRRWEASEKYQLHNLSSNESRIGAFKLAAEDHREQYKDKTGTLMKIQEMRLPKMSRQTSPIWKQVNYP